MDLRKQVVSFLATWALLPPHAHGKDPDQVVVQGKHDPSTIVVRGVRDPSGWFRIESQHLIVYSNDVPDDVIELVNNLERLDFLLRIYLKPFMDAHEDMPKPTLYFQARANWPEGIGAHSSNAVGMFNSCVSGTQAFTHNVGKSWKLDNASLRHPGDDYTLMGNLSLYAENFLYRHTGIRGPLWFKTAYAAYFSGVHFTDTQMAIGRDGGTSYDGLQQIDGGSLWRLSLDEVLRYKPGHEPMEVGTPAYYRQWEFLGRSFNLVHYALSSEENRDKLGRYLDLVNNGSDPGSAFTDVFGLSGRKLDLAMWHYRHEAMKILQVDVPGLPKARIDFTRLSRIEAEFVLDNAVLKTCPAPADGRKLLARLTETAAKAPAVDLAQITLSRAQVDWGNPRDAIGYLSRAVENDPYNPEPQYLLGLAYAKLADGAGQDKAGLLAAARERLTQAAVLAPEAPEAAYALFRLALTDPDPAGKDVARAIDAWRHGRDVPAFARAAALAHAWLGDTADAYQAFNTLVRDDRDPASAAWAVAWLAKLEKGVPRAGLLAAMRAEWPALPGYRSWMDDGP